MAHAQVVVKVNDTVNFRLGFQLQGWGEYLQDPISEGYQQSFKIRRVRLILAGAMISGVLLALAVHMLGARFGLDLGGLWRSSSEFMPAGAAVAWWLIATVGFCGGYFSASFMDNAASGQIPPQMRQFLIAVGVLVLAGAGQAASAPSPIPTISGVLAGLAALFLGALMAFCGAHFALRKA